MQIYYITLARKSQDKKKDGEIVENAVLTPFGKQIKKRLVDIDRTQAWLIEQVRGVTGLYFDRSYMYKIQTGQLSTPKIVRAIQNILELPEQDQDTTDAG